VIRVKILFNKKDSALVQMAENHQAHLGKIIKILSLLNSLEVPQFFVKKLQSYLSIAINYYDVYGKCNMFK